jgi:hypothetical protein
MRLRRRRAEPPAEVPDSRLPDNDVVVPPGQPRWADLLGERTEQVPVRRYKEGCRDAVL